MLQNAKEIVLYGTLVCGLIFASYWEKDNYK